MRGLVYLDRDGVLNKSIVINNKPFAPRVISEVIILPGVIEAIQILKEIQFIPIVISNQPDVASGFILESEVHKINKKISEITKIERIYTCFHNDASSCECRKPKTGLLVQGKQEFSNFKGKTYLVGDRWRDIEAGQKFGCECYYIDNEYDEKKPIQPFEKVSNLLEACELIARNVDEQ